MRESSSLLLGQELNEFLTDQTKIRRRMLSRRPVEGPDQLTVRTLEVLVGDELQEVTRAARKTGRALKVLTISVAANDGMSWSAAMAEQAAAMAAARATVSPTPRPVCLRGRTAGEGDPEIMDVVGRRRLVRLAQRHRVTQAFPLLRPWVRGVILAVALILTALGQVLAASLQASTPSRLSPGTLLTNPSYILLALAVAGAVLAAQGLPLFAGTRRSSEALRSLGDELRNKRDTKEYWRLVESVADWLRKRPMPRYLIVDGYERLHPFTCNVLETYLARYAKAAQDFELWVIFENEEALQFHHHLQTATAREEPWAVEAGAYRQQFVEPDERRRLAQMSNYPDGQNAETVMGIRGKIVERTDRYERYFRAYEARSAPVQRYDALDLLYLVSLTAEDAGSLMLSDRSIRERFSPKRPLRAKVLAQFLKGTALSREEFSSTLSVLQEHFSDVLEVDEAYAFRVEPGVRRFLSKHYRDYALPDPRFGHLFWALLSHDLLQEPTAETFWVRKLAAHVLATRVPGTIPLDQPLPQEVKDAFVEATLFAISACLRCCLLNDLPELLRLAESLVESREPGTASGWRRRLASLTWQAYSVLGDEEVLGIAISLRSRQARAGLQAVGDGVDPLDDLFLQSLSPPGGGGRPRQELLLAWSQAGEPTQTYGRVRAFWLAQTLGSLLDGLEPKLQAAKEIEIERLLPPIQAALERSQQASKRLVIDILGASIGLWALTVAVVEEASRLARWEHERSQAVEAAGGVLRDRHDKLTAEWRARQDELFAEWQAQHADRAGSLVEQLNSGYVVAGELRKLRTRTAIVEGLQRLDFVLDVLATELFVMIGACAALLLRAHDGMPEEAFVRQNRTDADSLVEWSLDEASAAGHATRGDDGGEDPFRQIDRQMGLLRVVWASLGLEQLSGLMSLRRAQLRLVRAAMDVRGAAALTRELPDDMPMERRTKGFVGLLANALVAKAAEAKAERRALAIGHGVDAALDAGFGRELATELCLLAVGMSHTLPLPLDRFLRYLTEGDGAATPLADLLDALPDKTIPTIALELLNSIRHIEQDELGMSLAREVPAALRTRANRIEDQQAAESISDDIELFELENALERGEPVDIKATIDSWKAKVGRPWNYAWALYQLLGHVRGRVDDQLLVAATAFLAQDETFSAFNCSILLADRLAGWVSGERHNLDPARHRAALDAAVELLRRAHPLWENTLGVETNIHMLLILEQHDKPRERQHSQRRIIWQVEQHRRDLERKLPWLVQHGQWFLVFTHYYHVLAGWDLPADRSADELFPLLDDNEQTTRKLFEEWQATGKLVPAPFVERATRLTLSGSFLAHGGCLFRAPFVTQKQLDPARDAFNRGARDALPRLLLEITSLRSIPAEIRQVLMLHQAVLLGGALATPARAASRAS
jgi:hypothetical protein